MEVLTRINAQYSALSASEKRVANYIQSNPEAVVSLPLAGIAGECGVSDATVMRFCRTLGYSGFQDLKSTFIPELFKRGTGYHTDSNENPYSKLQERLSVDVRSTFSLLQMSTLEAVADVLGRSRQIILLGLAGSAGVARIFADSLNSVGLNATYLSDRVEIERICDNVSSDETVFGVSHSGENQEVCAGLERSRERGAATISITNFDPSPVTKHSDYVLLTSTPESLLGSYSCYPRVLELLILDLLVGQVARRLTHEDR